MKRALKIFVLAIMLLTTAATDALSRVYVFYAGVVRDTEGNPTDCYRFLVVYTAMVDGEEQLVAAGFVTTGPDCGGWGAPVNPNCPSYVCDDETFYTDDESPECLGPIICGDAEIHAEYVEARDAAWPGSPRGSGTNTMESLEKAPKTRWLVAYPNPVVEGNRELTINLNAPALSKQASPQLVIYDVAGKRVASATPKPEEYQLKLKLPATSGTYTVILSAGGKVLVTHKVVVQ